MEPYKQCLEQLESSIPEYIKSVGTFQWENETFELIGHYFSPIYEKCEVCGHYPIREIFLIQNTKTKEKFKVGNRCIDKITNQKISKWFRNYHKRQKTIIKNKKWINAVSGILEAYENEELPIYISQKGIERLEKMLKRMCEGYNPTKTQLRLASYYIEKILRAVGK